MRNLSLRLLDLARSLLAAFVCASPFYLLAACNSPPDASQSPNILLVTLDTTRRDHLSAYGYRRRTSPFLERLASQGVRFDAAYAPTATTGPSHSSLFTSLYPPTHGVVKNGLTLVDAHLTLAEKLAIHGYQTVGVASSFVLDRRFGYGQGFDVYFDDFDRETASFSADSWEGHSVEGGFDRRADETARLAISWLQNDRDPALPFFLFVHFFDPHSPYSPPADALDQVRGETETPLGDVEEIVLNYDAEIAFTDQQLGRLMSALDRLELSTSTLVVVTSDHGEGLMQHGHMEHGLHIYEEAVRVPLIMRWTGHLAAGTEVAAPVGLIDLAPTLTHFAGSLPATEFAEGRDLHTMLAGENSWDEKKEVFLFRRHYATEVDSPGPRGIKLGIRKDRWKYIWGPDEQTEELFDLHEDPGETTNLVGRGIEAERLLRGDLLQWWTTVPRVESSRAPVPRTEDLERLRALGYIE